jgi:hypothetical protein
MEICPVSASEEIYSLVASNICEREGCVYIIRETSPKYTAYLCSEYANVEDLYLLTFRFSCLLQSYQNVRKQYLRAALQFC